MRGEDEPSRPPYDLGLARFPPPINSGAIDEALSSLGLLETKEEGLGALEIVVGGVSERKEGSDRVRGEARDGENEKREIEEGEEGIDSGVEKTENEERAESSDDAKGGTEKREEGIDGDIGNIETEKGEEVIDGDSYNVKTESDGDGEEKSEEKEQGRNAGSEDEIGVRKQRIDCGSKPEEMEERGEVRYGDNEKKEIGEKEEDRDGHSEDKGEEEMDCRSEKKGEKMLKERIKFPIIYPQRPFTPDCPSYLKTGYCAFGLVCCFNHPLRKSSKVSPNRDYKVRERDGDQEKKELVGRCKVMHAQPYPQREGKGDCLFYLKTGRCSYGVNCCFNHPPRNPNKVTEDVKDQTVLDDENGPREAERNWSVSPSTPHIRRRPDCARYVKEGRCDYGAECRFFHHRNRRPYEFNLNPGSEWREKLELETNFLGLPLRPGKDDCPEYIKHGACELSTNCQHNHPNPDPVIAKQDTHKEFDKGNSLSSLEEHAAHVPNPTCGLAASIKPMFIPTPKPSLARIKQMLLPPERPADIGDGYKEPQYRARPGEPLCPAYMKSGGCKLKSECWYDHPKDPAKPAVQSDSYNRESSTMGTKKKMVHGSIMSDEESIYPERPGEPECAYYMKHGDCKFRSTCKFHHPRYLRNKPPTYSSFAQASRATSGNCYEEMAFPERPGEPECAYYIMHGDCKFGSNCKFHHPKGRNGKKSSQWGYRKFMSRRYQNGLGYQGSFNVF